MARIYLIHWNNEERSERIHQLTSAGHEVVSDLPNGPSFAKHVEEQNPDVILIDLSRLPSQGRDLGVMMRSRKGTRCIPILFVGGAAEKVEPIKQLLPDAIYTSWKDLISEIKTAIETKGKEFASQDSVFAAYAGKPLDEKLGIKPGSRVCFFGAPEEIKQIMTDLSINATLVWELDAHADLTLWFMGSEAELINLLEEVVEQARHAPCWIAWQKSSSGVKTDLNQQNVRRICMASGMVDYKICSIDSQWSALLFRWRG